MDLPPRQGKSLMKSAKVANKSTKSRATKGPQFVRFFGPVLDALRQLGGSGSPSEVRDAVVVIANVSEQEQGQLLKSGAPRFNNQIYWVRFYLSKAGFIANSQNKIWDLTDDGWNTYLSHEKALEVFKKVQQQFPKGTAPVAVEDAANATEEIASSISEDGAQSTHREVLIKILRSLPPQGFEHLCQHLLRKAGFQQVEVTGRSGDGGIDGQGILEINPFVSFRILFQCKRVEKTVSPSQVRDFRGAMAGRADKGLIMTTGTFTSNARQEAIRDGASPIELVDIEKMLDMFEQLQLGLRPITAFEVVPEFFDKFQNSKELLGK